MKIASVCRAMPQNYYDQDELTAAIKDQWRDQFYNQDRLDLLHKNVLVGGRHLALPIERYQELGGFRDANNEFIRLGTELGAEALKGALEAADIPPSQVDHVFFVSVTGIATPSIEARLVQPLGLNPHVRRTPIFGLGCVAGTAGVARAADYLRGNPDHVAVVLSVELCSLTLQRNDLSIANLISTGLFGDGAVATVIVGDHRPAAGPQILASRAVFYPDSEYVMGWNISEDGFQVVLSSDVPEIIGKNIGRDVDAFLESQGLNRGDIGSYVAHPGGPKVLEALADALDITKEDLIVSWESLAEVGNLSSASVLMILEDTMKNRRPPAGTYGLMLAMGPGFSSEMVLMKW